jgi:hypothetical protein
LNPRLTAGSRCWLTCARAKNPAGFPPEWIRNEKFLRDGKSRALIRFQSYFLCEHHIAGDQVTDRKKTSADKWVTFRVELLDICRDAISNTVPNTRYVADHVEIPVRVKLVSLFGRQPGAQKAQSLGLSVVCSKRRQEKGGERVPQ